MDTSVFLNSTSDRGRSWGRRRAATHLAIAGLLLAAGGCEARLDPAQYGEIVTKLPKIEGADKPYQLPDLDEPTEDAAATDQPRK
jgi:hypothetical protein